MAERSYPTGRVRISPIDMRGRAIDPDVLNVANEISERALRYGEAQLGDPALAASLLEESAATVSRVIATQSQTGTLAIRNLEAYLFRAFLRRINRAKRRDLRLIRSTCDNVMDTHRYDPSQELAQKLFIDELLTKCDTVTQDILNRRRQGFSWNEIGMLYGISGHSAESRVRRALKRLRKTLLRDSEI